MSSKDSSLQYGEEPKDISPLYAKIRSGNTHLHQRLIAQEDKLAKGAKRKKQEARRSWFKFYTAMRKSFVFTSETDYIQKRTQKFHDRVNSVVSTAFDPKLLETAHSAFLSVSLDVHPRFNPAQIIESVPKPLKTPQKATGRAAYNYCFNKDLISPLKLLNSTTSQNAVSALDRFNPDRPDTTNLDKGSEIVYNCLLGIHPLIQEPVNLRETTDCLEDFVGDSFFLKSHNKFDIVSHRIAARLINSPSSPFHFNNSALPFTCGSIIASTARAVTALHETFEPTLEDISEPEDINCFDRSVDIESCSPRNTLSDMPDHSEAPKASQKPQKTQNDQAAKNDQKAQNDQAVKNDQKPQNEPILYDEDIMASVFDFANMQVAKDLSMGLVGEEDFKIRGLDAKITRGMNGLGKLFAEDPSRPVYADFNFVEGIVDEGLRKVVMNKVFGTGISTVLVKTSGAVDSKLLKLVRDVPAPTRLPQQKAAK